MSFMRPYRNDLAYIHDAGFSDYCLKAAPGLVRILRLSGIPNGLVVDLGCGSGRWARELNRNGYEAFGIDQSRTFIRIARRVAPQSSFAVASLPNVILPPCDAVTSIGECLNYSFEEGKDKGKLSILFAEVYRIMRTGGAFIFDLAGPARVPEGRLQHRGFYGRDWAILVGTSGNNTRTILTRHIISFRKVGRQYRRDEETHRLRLYRPDKVLRLLRKTGFHAYSLSSYGRFRLPVGITAFVARKE